MTAAARPAGDTTFRRLARSLGRLASKLRGRARRHVPPHASRPNPAHASARLKSGSLRAMYVPEQRTRAEGSARGAADRSAHALRRALAHPDPLRRVLALEVICRFSEVQGAEALMKMLGDLDPTVRRAAASAAARLAPRRVVSRLIMALGDPDLEVRRACQRALETTMEGPIESVDDLDAARLTPVISDLIRRWKLQRLAELRAAAGSQNTA